jgi:predicted metalloprotease with PDZ domain
MEDSMRRFLPFLALVAVMAIVPGSIHGQQASTSYPIIYRVTFPEVEHHWMQVEVTWTNLGTQPFDARMSRSSPGRYAVAEFAKNVFSVEAFDGKGKKLATTRPDADVWRIAGHDGTVRVVYKIFGDYANGTFFGVDSTHAHLQMPAAFMWGVGHDNDAVRITFVPPGGSKWRVGTQLYSTNDGNTFTAPNLQYFMDSPTELSDFIVSSFAIPNSDGTPANFRLVVHSDASQGDVDELAKMVERLLREQMAVFGEFPKYEPGNYSFLLDYVSWSVSDGMEHRNSTSISNSGLSLRTPQGRQQALGPISHEYFHNWNMERIRSSGIEPFDFTRENVTCCLWEGEGFTQYYGPLLLMRAGIGAQRGAGALLNSAIQVINAPGRAVRSPVEMSEYAPFADGAGAFIDSIDANRTFLSYYTYGAGIALALDLSLRDMSGGRISLDDYMKLLWQQHGRPGGPVPGVVANPYTLKDLRDHLSTLTGNRKFADDFFDRYIEGREAPDYERLLADAGYVLQMAPIGKGWIGNIPVAETPNGLTVGGGGFRLSPIPFDTPVYDAGIDAGDVVKTIDGQPATVMAWNAIASKRPGETAAVGVMRRGGTLVAKTITVKQDPTAQSVVPVESLPGRSLTAAQLAFRQAWLSTKVK